MGILNQSVNKIYTKGWGLPAKALATATVRWSIIGGIILAVVFVGGSGAQNSIGLGHSQAADPQDLALVLGGKNLGEPDLHSRCDFA